MVKSANIYTGGKQTVLAQKEVILGNQVRLASGRVHEVTGCSADAFIASVISQMSGKVVWIGRAKEIYSLCPQALQTFFCPSRLLTIEAISRQEILWAAEQALRSKGIGCVVVEISQGPNLKESRRLQLSAEQGKTLGLIKIGKTAQSSAAQTRWLCTPLEATSLAANDHIWQWEMIKNKNGQTGRWQVEWRQNANDTCDVHMVSAATA